MGAPGFWDDQAAAARISTEHSRATRKLERYERLQHEHDDVTELLALGEDELGDEVSEIVELLESELGKLQEDALFTGEYDAGDAVLQIHAGTGGTDAQDWAEMLLRMYQRWASDRRFEWEMVEASPGEEAGLKSTTMTVKGENAYGTLKAERGVHRLVRLSPFDAAHRRHTAFSQVVVAPLLLVASLGLAYFVGGSFLPWLAGYFLLTCLYSFKLKQVVLVDCLILAVLYTLRIVAGAAAVEMSLSFWLLAFSGFLFLSLAFVKRFAELQVQLLHGKHKAAGRGYFTDDAPLVQMLGIVAGYAAVLVLALYLNSADVLRLYLAPEWIWGCVPVMLFWVSWVWLQAHRGQMHDDPLVFAVKDKASLIAGATFAIFMALGTVGWMP